MKNKKSIYILGPLVLLIWALVIYRIFSYSAVVIAEPSLRIESSPEDMSTFEPDSFVLHADYTEPFLIDEKTYLSNARPLREKDKKQVEEVIPELPKWPSIAYLGTIGNKKKRKQLSLIKIGDKEYFFKQGEEKEEIMLLKNYGDSVKLRFQGAQEKVLKKNT